MFDEISLSVLDLDISKRSASIYDWSICLSILSYWISFSFKVTSSLTLLIWTSCESWDLQLFYIWTFNSMISFCFSSLSFLTDSCCFLRI